MKITTRKTLQVASFANAIVFLLFAGISVPFFSKQIEILKSWPAVQAEVVRSEVVSLENTKGRTLYDARYEFRYRIHDAIFTTMVKSNQPSTSQNRKQKQVDRVPPGTQQLIRYNPLNPTDVRMYPGYNARFFAIPLFISGVGFFFFVLASLLWGMSRWNKHTQPIENSTYETPSGR